MRRLSMITFEVRGDDGEVAYTYSAPVADMKDVASVAQKFWINEEGFTVSVSFDPPLLVPEVSTAAEY